MSKEIELLHYDSHTKNQSLLFYIKPHAMRSNKNAFSTPHIIIHQSERDSKKTFTINSREYKPAAAALPISHSHTNTQQL